MRPSRIILLLVAILAGGLAAFLATRGDAPAPQVVVSEPTIIEEQKTKILVAIAPIGVGQRLSTKTVDWQDWPEGAVRPEYISVAASPDALEQLSGTVARFEIFPGEPVTEQKLVRSNQGYLSAVLDKGKRGISIPVAAASASGGFIVPNDHVDVVLTRSSSAGLVSETILRNVKVLAIGRRLGETGTTGAPEDPDSPRTEVFSGSAIATLELDPPQGELVINAQRIGTLSLALRSIADFRPDPAEANIRSTQQAVRMIRGGNRVSVMAGSPTTAEATVDPASYNPGETDLPPTDVATPATEVPTPPVSVEQ